MAFFANAALPTVLALGIVVLPLMVARPAAAQSFSLLHSFSGMNGADGSAPFDGLIVDSSGNFYGTTFNGGTFGFGTVYELPAEGGEKVLYNFTGGNDGANPAGSLILDGAGNLYGTTTSGGPNSCYFNIGCGVVFRLSPQGTETILYTFTGQGDGGVPLAGLIRDARGNLYGTASQGGQVETLCGVGCGVVFKLNPAGQETVLHTFTGPPDGANPLAPLVQDSAGNLYGTTELGGAGCYGHISVYGCGTVFKLDRQGHETILYSFTQAADGGSPQAGLVLDPGGNLYGTTTNGGDNLFCKLGNGFGCGVVFKVDPLGNETVLYAFPSGAAGAVPFASLVRDAKGNLYGTTAVGGSFSGIYANGCGVVFKLTPSGYETVLHSFQLTDGCGPLGNLLADKGYLYGTASGGGVDGASSLGVVFQLQP
jgi:uncharacterized repeat protein (TIGR03803 family)